MGVANRLSISGGVRIKRGTGMRKRNAETEYGTGTGMRNRNRGYNAELGIKRGIGDKTRNWG